MINSSPLQTVSNEHFLMDRRDILVPFPTRGGWVENPAYPVRKSNYDPVCSREGIGEGEIEKTINIYRKKENP